MVRSLWVTDMEVRQWPRRLVKPSYLNFFLGLILQLNALELGGDTVMTPSPPDGMTANGGRSLRVPKKRRTMMIVERGNRTLRHKGGA